MQIRKKIKNPTYQSFNIKDTTAHRRACMFAALLVVLMTAFSYACDKIAPDISPYARIVLCSSLPLVIVSLLYGRVRHLHIRTFYRLKPIAPTAVGVWILFGIGANCFATLMNAPVYKLLLGFDALRPVSVHVPSTMTEYIIGIVCTALLPAFLEELFCRGVILREYERYGTVFAIFAAASMFALLHMSVASLVFTWVLGLILAVVVLKTDSLYPAVIVHFSVNFFSLTRGYLSNLMPSGFYELWSVVQLFVLVFFAFGFSFALVMLFMIHGRGHILKRDRSQRFGISLSFIFLIVVYILNHVRLIAEMIG